ncbi:MAG: hypothetical protein GXX95_02285 [Methanomassiliicoccus sp.]|nr:hypothetical protein [Methanomassiliicoccus sp.]
MSDVHCYFCKYQFTSTKCSECVGHSAFKISATAQRIPSTEEAEEDSD